MFMHREVQDHYATLALEYNRKANRACRRAYRELVGQWFQGARRVLELGVGSQGVVTQLEADVKVCCDLSLSMLRAGGDQAGTHRLVANALAIPCPDGAFDGVICINLLEHAANPGQVFAEAARVLAPEGRCLAVTPNGDLEAVLHLIEHLHLKIPEGPHQFLTGADLDRAAADHFEIVEHRRMLAFPLGPDRFVRAIDHLVRGAHGRGLFQYVRLVKRG